MVDSGFKDELSAVEHWFTILSAAEQIALLYTLAQYVNPVQNRFLTFVLQRMMSPEPLSAIEGP
ncbi:hypothetical protein GQ42DRAFT_121375, partial [Ramicandelaber brevisporus]